MTLKLDKVSILVVEDTTPMRKLVIAVVQSLGFTRIYFASNGEQGFLEFQKLNPDLVITDWLMDQVDGIELTRMIRSRPDSPNQTVPIIMMTGYSAIPRVMQARDQGVTEFLVKPFTASDLAKRIAYVINRPRDFVQAPVYFGPDRRRKVAEEYKGGQDRRGRDYDVQIDPADIDFVSRA